MKFTSLGLSNDLLEASRSVLEGSKEYQDFFKSALKKFGVTSPAEFKSDEEKKKFFDYVDKNYKGKSEELTTEEVQLDEIQQKEVDALKKLSKDMQSVLKGYQKIARMGDKELTNTKYNKDYEAVLKSRDTILQLIGKVNTQKILNKEEVVVEEKLSLEKTISKLTEKNMLGRLAKSMELNEDNKDKLFNYFDKGELEQ
jgi:hypothetical protein